MCQCYWLAHIRPPVLCRVPVAGAEICETGHWKTLDLSSITQPSAVKLALVLALPLGASDLHPPRVPPTRKSVTVSPIESQIYPTERA
jgi:hypothetical protein